MVSRFRVLVITPDFPPDIAGGCGASSGILVRELRLRGIEVDVLAFTGQNAVVRSANGTKFYLLRGSKVSFSVPFLSNMLVLGRSGTATGSYDLVHVFNTDHIFSSYLVGRLKGAKVVATLNNINCFCTDAIEASASNCSVCNPLESLRCSLSRRKKGFAGHMYAPLHWAQLRVMGILAKRIDHFIAISEEMRRIYVNAGFPQSKMTVFSHDGLATSIGHKSGMGYKVTVHNPGKLVRTHSKSSQLLRPS